MRLLAGEYELGVEMRSPDFSHLYDSLESALGFSLLGQMVPKVLRISMRILAF